MDGNVTGARLKQRLEELGWDQDVLAEKLNVSQSAISQIITGKSRRSRLLPEIAHHVTVNLDWLQGLTEDRGSVVLKDRRLGYKAGMDVEPEDTVELNEFDLSFGLGASYIHDAPVTGVKRVFSRAWIRNFTKSPFEYLMFATGIGDSQVPVILDADILLIDTFDRTPRFSDKLWAIEIGGLGAIKRLRPTKDRDGMQLLCANPDVPDDIAYDGEMQVIGRVAGVFRKT